MKYGTSPIPKSIGACKFAIAGALFGSLLFGLPLANAHHSNSAYDTSKTVTWKVMVTEFKFVNPHAYVYFTMPDASGKEVAGRCEFSARTLLVKLGWTADTFKVGEALTIKGQPARNEQNVCVATSFVRADGTEVGTRENLPK